MYVPTFLYMILILRKKIQAEKSKDIFVKDIYAWGKPNCGNKQVSGAVVPCFLFCTEYFFPHFVYANWIYIQDIHHRRWPYWLLKKSQENHTKKSTFWRKDTSTICTFFSLSLRVEFSWSNFLKQVYFRPTLSRGGGPDVSGVVLSTPRILTLLYENLENWWTYSIVAAPR